MEDLKKIRSMTNLAIYDKHDGERDRKITSNYKADYMFKRGFSMRMGVLLGCIIVAAVYYFYKIFVLESDIFEIISKTSLIEMGAMVFGVLLIYTIICRFGYSREYDEAEERMEIYEKQLERLNGPERAESYEEEN